MRPVLTFRPPRVAIDASLRYVLARAFGPAPIRPPAADPREVLELAARLELAGRLAVRTGLAQLAHELGRPVAVELTAVGERWRAAAAQRETLVQGLAALAERVGVELVLLKAAALENLRVTLPGVRRAGDVDVLVADHECRRFDQALADHGFVLTGLPGHAHQLPPRRDVQGNVVELHTHLPGLRRNLDARPAGLLELRADLLPAHGLPPVAKILPAPLLAAHLCVHALWQHGLQPHAYPPLRLLADLQDLGVDRWTEGDLATLLAWTAPTVAPQQMSSLLRLIERLGQGDVRLADEPSSCAERRLLDHLLAGGLDGAYRTHLRRRERFWALFDAAAWRLALVPTDAQVALSRAGRPLRLLRGLLRPFARARSGPTG